MAVRKRAVRESDLQLKLVRAPQHALAIRCYIETIKLESYTQLVRTTFRT